MRLIVTCLLLVVSANWLSARNDDVIGTKVETAPMPREIRTFVSKEGKFSARFPANYEIKISEGENGTLTNHLCKEIDIGKGIERAYFLSYMNMPEKVTTIPPKQIMDGATDGAVKTNSGKLLSSIDFKFGPQKYPARDIVIEKNGNKIRARMILVKTRFYVLLTGGAGGEKDFATTEEADRFFETFKVLE